MLKSEKPTNRRFSRFKRLTTGFIHDFYEEEEEIEVQPIYPRSGSGLDSQSAKEVGENMLISGRARPVIWCDVQRLVGTYPFLPIVIISR